MKATAISFGAVISLAVLSGSAAAGEGNVEAARGDVLTIFWRSLLQFGALGLWMIYMIYTNHEEKKQKRMDNSRFHALDERILTLVEKTTHALATNTNQTTELRDDIHDIKMELRRTNSILATGRAYSEAEPLSSGTRIIPRAGN